MALFRLLGSRIVRETSGIDRPEQNIDSSSATDGPARMSAL